MVTDYHIERITPLHYRHLVRLVRRCFGRSVLLASVAAKYDTSVFGARDVGYMAFTSTGQPVAYYGVFPIVVTVNGLEHLAAQSGDTMTDPDHQGKGLFIRLARMTYDLAEREGIRFVFGFPNDNSYPGFERKLNWKFSGRLKDLKFRSGALPMCEFASRYPWSRPFYLAFVRPRLQRIEAAPTPGEVAAMAPGPVCVTRSERFLRYKISGGARLVHWEGFTVLIRAEVHLYVGDVSRFPSEQAGSFKRALRSLARHLGCGRVVMSFSDDHWLYPMVAEVIDPSPGLPIGHLAFTKGLPVDRMSFTRADLDTF